MAKLILGFNKHLKSQVIRAKDKYNLKVRGIISDKTGLNLAFIAKDIYPIEIHKKDKQNISIEICDSVPQSLIYIFDRFDDNLLELLLHYRRMKSSVEELDFQLREYSDLASHHKERYSTLHIGKTKLHLQLLIQTVEDSGVLDAIQKLGPDLLGAYFLGDNRVELYWLCIGLCSIINDLPIEDFTLVVLTHELVHGYTHIGFDKDGNNWHTASFGNTDLKIVEGFAQFYTEMLCKDYFDHAIKAFNALLTKQASEYNEYNTWFQDNEADKYEKARRILLGTRNKNIKDYTDFINNLKSIKADF